MIEHESIPQVRVILKRELRRRTECTGIHKIEVEINANDNEWAGQMRCRGPEKPVLETTFKTVFQSFELCGSITERLKF